MTTKAVQQQQQVLTKTNDVYTAMHARLDRIEAMQDEAAHRYAQHEQHSAWLLQRIEEAQCMASAMIEASRQMEVH